MAREVPCATRDVGTCAKCCLSSVTYAFLVSAGASLMELYGAPLTCGAPWVVALLVVAWWFAQSSHGVDCEEGGNARMGR